MRKQTRCNSRASLTLIAAMLLMNTPSIPSALAVDSKELFDTYSNPETQPKANLPKMRGPAVMEVSPIFTIVEAARNVRYALFLYEDGTIIWNPAWNDYDSTSTNDYKLISKRNPDESFSSKAGPFFRGVVDSELIHDFIEDATNSEMCDHAGFSFLHGFHHPETYLIFAHGTCGIAYTHAFNYDAPEKIHVQEGLIDRDGKSEKELLANQHPMIQRAYNTHHFFTDNMKKMIENVEANGTKTEVGMLDLDLFEVEVE